jgi:hypothetical protein
MGRYNNGNGQYELGYYDQLWNGHEYLILDLKIRGRVRIVEARPQIYMGVHTWTIINLLLSKSH